MSLLGTWSNDQTASITQEYAASSTAVITPGAGRNGTQGVVTMYNSTFFVLDRAAYDQPFALLSLFHGISFRLAALPLTGRGTLIQFMEADNTPQIAITVNDHGIIEAYRGAQTGALLASSPSAVEIAVAYYLEVGLVINNATGSVELRLWSDADTVDTIINFTGDTQNGGTGEIARIGYGSDGNTPTNAVPLFCAYDDGYLCDSGGPAFNGFQGNKHIDLKQLTATGFYTTWLPFPGPPNWQNVSEVPADEATYNYVADYVTSATLDTFAAQAVDLLSSVNAVTVKLCARVVGSEHTVGAVMRRGGTDSESPGILPTEAFQTYQFPYEKAPDGSGWTAAKYNESEAGYNLDALPPHVDAVIFYADANQLTDLSDNEQITGGWTEGGIHHYSLIPSRDLTSTVVMQTFRSGGIFPDTSQPSVEGITESVTCTPETRDAGFTTSPDSSATNRDLFLPGAFTMIAVLRTTQYDGCFASVSGTPIIMRRRGRTPNRTGWEFALSPSSPTVAYVYFWRNDNDFNNLAYVQAVDAIAINTTYTVVVICDGSTVTLRINGVEIMSDGYASGEEPAKSDFLFLTSGDGRDAIQGQTPFTKVYNYKLDDAALLALEAELATRFQ